jgi:hypothetical protein
MAWFLGILLVLVVALVLIRGAIVMMTTGLVQCLEWERPNLNGCSYRLYVNNWTPAPSDGIAAYTQCNDSGYAAWVPAFAASTLNGSQQGQTVGPQTTFTFTLNNGPFTIYGYYVTRPSDGQVIYAEKASVPFSVSAAGMTYTVTPQKLMGTM